MNRLSRRVTFDGGNGFKLAGIVDGDQAGGDKLDGEKTDTAAPRPVVVFSHCFTCNKDLKAIVRISRQMAADGITVLRFDMTGLGDSDGDFSVTDFSSNVRDLHAAIAYASRTLGTVTGLIGHSLGGAATMAVAGSAFRSSNDPESPRPSTPLSPWTPMAIATLAAPSDTVHLATLLSSMNPAIDRDGQGPVTIGGRTWTIRKETLQQFRGGGLPDTISHIECPAMIFHSPSDKTVSFDHAIRIAGLIRGGQSEGGQNVAGQRVARRQRSASLVTLPGADHLLATNNDDWKVVAEMSAAFFRRYASSKSKADD